MTEPDPGKPRLLVVAGPNGSGKTTVTEQVLKHRWFDGCEYINPDNIAEQQYGGWNSAEAVLQAANHAQALRERCLAEGRDMAFETVFSADDKVQFIERALAAGYFVRVFFVSTCHPSLNAARITYRVMNGGHDVSIAKIIARYRRSIVNCTLIARRVDRLYVYDNSVDGAEARLMFRARYGELAKVYAGPIERWADSIHTALRAPA